MIFELFPVMPSLLEPLMATPRFYRAWPYSASLSSLGLLWVMSNTSVLGWQEGRSVTPGMEAGKGSLLHLVK